MTGAAPHPGGPAACEKWIQEHQRAAEAVQDATGRGPTLGELLAPYEAEVGGRTRSWPKERFRAVRLLAELGADRPVAAITVPEVVAMRDRLKRREGRLDQDSRRASAVLQLCARSRQRSCPAAPTPPRFGPCPLPSQRQRRPGVRHRRDSSPCCRLEGPVP